MRYAPENSADPKSPDTFMRMPGLRTIRQRDCRGMDYDYIRGISNDLITHRASLSKMNQYSER